MTAKPFLILSVCLLAWRAVNASGAEQTLPSARIFAPGVISGPANDGSPTFSPDGDTLFFTRSSARWSIILESHQLAGHWSEPKIASFSGKWSDSSPAMSPDGSYIVYVSARPKATSPIDKNAGGRPTVSHIWRVSRMGQGWSEPVELPKGVNFCDMIFRPSVASDGSVYFTAAGQGKNLRLFRSACANGSFRNAEALPFSDGNLKDVDPEIAPDQSFLIFTSLGRGDSDGSHEKLFITYNRGGVWDKAAPLRYAGDDANGSSDDNDARLGHDHKTLYFSSDRTPTVHFPRTQDQANQDFERLGKWDNGNANIWMISLGELLPERTN